MFILYTLNMRVRNWCVHLACTSGTNVYAEPSRQEIMPVQRIRVRNRCVHWEYGSGTNSCTERSPFKTCWAYASGTDTYPEHTGHKLSISVKNSKFEKVPSNHADHARKELMHALSLHIRNYAWLCVCVRNWRLAPPKIKVTRLYFSPKVTTKKGFIL
jgi:hypothetical protein